MDPDKVLGAWMGMAAGDALGQAGKGLKPEAIRQLYKHLDTYQDVRPFIGKGVKSYRMKGLYGWQTQLALALAESMGQKKGVDAAAFGDLLVRMSVGGPEFYFGVFRRPEGVFARSVMEFASRVNPEAADFATVFGSFFPAGITPALYFGKDSATFREAVSCAGRMWSSHPWEQAGTAAAGFLVQALAREKSEYGQARLPEAGAVIGRVAEQVREFEQRYCSSPETGGPADAVSRTLLGLAARFDGSTGEELEQWIVENANSFLKQPINHAAQGQVLSLLPLAVVLVLGQTDGFDPALARSAEKGREAVKLGTLAGALAGALYGWGAMGNAFKVDLVNHKEVKNRGEALLKRRAPAAGKDLIAMEMGLTRKEAEEGRKTLPKAPKKSTEPPPLTKKQLFEDLGVEWEDDPLAEIRDNPRLRRQFEKDKTRKKRDRRH